jgi:release factor glutamine methyltransferase
VTIKEIYTSYLQQLKQIYTASEASIITDRVFVATAGIGRGDLIKNPSLLPAENIVQKLKLQLQELLKHKPVQYVLGEAWFYNMKLAVNEHTLIPRPETEELVKLVIDDYRQTTMSKQESINVLDIGTGSGCIAIALKKNLPTINMTAIDVSPEALSISTQNAASQKVSVDFLQLDFLNELQWKLLPHVDLIVSNPPYIPVSEKAKLEKNVTDFEPATALFVPDNSPFIFYEKIAAFAKSHLLPEGKIFVEVNEDLASQTAQIFQETFENVTIKKDMFEKERMVIVNNK